MQKNYIPQIKMH